MRSKQPDERLLQSALEHAHKDFPRIPLGHSVAEALAAVQQSQIASRIVYFYVLDDEGRLQGVVPTRRLLLSSPDTPVADIMVKQVIRLPADATLLDACEMFLLHRLMALPVVDDEGRMLGVVDVDEYTEELNELGDIEQANDVFQLIGVRIAQVKGAGLVTHFRSRFPWLLANIGGGLACAVIGALFQATLDQVIVLALFIPVVLALAESVSVQSLTLTLQAQHGTRIAWKNVLLALARELPVGVALGGACGLLVGTVAWIWQWQVGVAVTILASILLSVTTATVLGLLVPSTMLAVQRDPKVASGPITLAITDVLTMVYYLGLATWWLV
jgi:magnesium transporter